MNDGALPQGFEEQQGSSGLCNIIAVQVSAQPAHTPLVQESGLRYFGGLTLAEAAESLGISSRTADRLWAYAKAWLYQELSGKLLA
jgi:hypothetical protein